MLFLGGLHTILLDIDFKQNKTSRKTLITFGDKKSWSPNGLPRRTSRSPRRFIGRLGRPVILHTGSGMQYKRYKNGTISVLLLQHTVSTVPFLY